MTDLGTKLRFGKGWDCVVSENIHTSPTEGGSQKTKKIKEMYEVKLEFPEGWVALKKIPSVGEVWIFYGTTHFKKKKRYYVYTFKNIFLDYIQFYT